MGPILLTGLRYGSCIQERASEAILELGPKLEPDCDCQGMFFYFVMPESCGEVVIIACLYLLRWQKFVADVCY